MSLWLTGAGAAQMSPGMPSTEQTSGGTATGTMSAAHPMSADDMAKMKSCNAMSESEMAKHADCMAMMHAHPDMMKHTGAMKSGG